MSPHFGISRPPCPYCPIPQGICLGFQEFSKRVTNPFREPLQRLLPFLPSSRTVSRALRDLYAVYDDIFTTLK